MIFLNCNISWGHSTKNRKASYNLEKNTWMIWVCRFLMENPKDFFFYFDLINACESKGRFCQKRLFCSDCLSVNRYHFWTVWATDPRLVSNERYFGVVLGEKQRQWYFQRVIPPNMNDFVVSGFTFCWIDFKLTKCIQNFKKDCLLSFSQKVLQNSFYLGPIWHL